MVSPPGEKADASGDASHSHPRAVGPLRPCPRAANHIPGACLPPIPLRISVWLNYTTVSGRRKGRVLQTPLGEMTRGRTTYRASAHREVWTPTTLLEGEPCLECSLVFKCCFLMKLMLLMENFKNAEKYALANKKRYANPKQHRPFTHLGIP